MSLAVRSFLLASTNLVKCRPQFIQNRYYVKKKPDYTDNPKKHRPSKLLKTLRGFQFTDGERVYKDDILVRQRGLEFYPGENVKLNRDNWDLVATRGGQFMITTEKLSPFPDSPLYASTQAGNVLYKHFVHVVEEKLPEPEYKLLRLL